MFNYPREYVQLPWRVCSTTLGSMFNYLGEYVQLPWGVCSSTLGGMYLGSMFNYPGEYVQLPFCCSLFRAFGPPLEVRKKMGSWQARHFVRNFDTDLVGWV